jgi:hypothetical protein
MSAPVMAAIRVRQSQRWLTLGLKENAVVNEEDKT